MMMMERRRPVQPLLPVASSNRNGFTLVETLVAMVIVLVALLGLVQATLLSIESNLKNLYRDEAVRLAEEQLNVLKNLPIGNTQPPPKGLKMVTDWALYPIGAPIFRDVRNNTHPYAVYVTIVDLDASSKSIQVTVGWNHKNELPLQLPTRTEYRHSITSIVSSGQ